MKQPSLIEKRDREEQEAWALLDLQSALDTLGLELVLREVRDWCQARVGHCYTRRERELSVVSDDLGTTLRETKWEHLR